MNTLSMRSTTLSPSLPLKARLSPQAFQLQARNRNALSIRPLASSTTSSLPDPKPTPNPTTPKTKPLTNAQRDYLTSALRVNQAGELAAILIYAAQTPPILKSHPHLRSLMKHMYDQEHGHYTTFNALMAKHRIRPTAMYPLWSTLSTGLGWVTGAMGREAAMACTEAVETEIGEHYNQQVGELLRWKEDREREGDEGLGEELEELLTTVRRIRDEELEHLDHAVGEDAKMAWPYEVLNGVVRAGCRGAIWVSERV